MRPNTIYPQHIIAQVATNVCICDHVAGNNDETRRWIRALGLIPVVSPRVNRFESWDYDKYVYKKRNEVERLFQRLKGFCRIFSRFETFDIMFKAFINVALIFEMICLNTP